MRTIREYKELFRQRGIYITEDEIRAIIENMDNIWNLLFKKYKENIENKIKYYE